MIERQGEGEEEGEGVMISVQGKADKYVIKRGKRERGRNTRKYKGPLRLNSLWASLGLTSN